MKGLKIRVILLLLGILIVSLFISMWIREGYESFETISPTTDPPPANTILTNLNDPHVNVPVNQIPPPAPAPAIASSPMPFGSIPVGSIPYPPSVTNANPNSVSGPRCSGDGKTINITNNY